jgi:hypothetical protein
LKKFTAVTIASVAAIALFLTGCSTASMAATIGSTKITQATVQKSIDTVMAERTGVDTSQMQLETGEDLNRGQLRFHLFAGLLRAAASDLKIDSPYNTYFYGGLPPGPIAMPDITAIEAVLNPEKHNYIYFCASVTRFGYHEFAVNVSDHEVNRANYIAWLKKQIQLSKSK